MPNVKCTLKDCTYRGDKGGCHRKSIVLQQTESELQELYCLGYENIQHRVINDTFRDGKFEDERL